MLNKEMQEKILHCERQLEKTEEQQKSNLLTLYKVEKLEDLTEEQAVDYYNRLAKTLSKKGIETAIIENAKNNPKPQPKLNGKEVKNEVAVETDKPVAQQKKNFEQVLTEQLNLNIKALPPNFNIERFKSNALNMMLDPQRNKIDWDKLDKKEVIKCLIDGAKYDCEYGKEFYIIPFYNKTLGRQVATIMFDYKGLLRAMIKFSHKPIKNIVSGVVYEGDKFEVLPLNNPPVNHQMMFMTTEDKEIKFAYCVILYEDGGYDFEVMTRKQLDQVQFSTKKESSNFWKDWYSEMARKSAIRRISKKVILDFPSAEVEKVWRDDLERDNAYNPNEQQQEERKVIDVMSEVA